MVKCLLRIGDVVKGSESFIIRKQEGTVSPFAKGVRGILKRSLSPLSLSYLGSVPITRDLTLCQNMLYYS